MRLKARLVLLRRYVRKKWHELSYRSNRNKYCFRGKPGPAYRAKHCTPLAKS